MLIAPCAAASSTLGGRSSPYAATTMASARAARRRSATSRGRRLSGWKISRSLACARVFTGLGLLRMPRPAGRSGWVSTSATSCRPSSSASARSANAGVPAKIRRRNADGSGGLAQLLSELGADALLLQLRQMLDEDLALQMIHLVLDAYGKQALRLERERIAVLVVGTHFHALGPRHQLVDSRDRKAAFLDVRLASRFDNLRIDQHHERIAPLGDVDH